MSKTIDIPFHHWSLTFNGNVPVGNYYGSEPEYIARIYYRTKIEKKLIEKVDREVFNSRQKALDWIDLELKEQS